MRSNGSKASPRSANPPLGELARAVRARRSELGLSQLELANLGGCGVALVYAIEKGKPSLRLDKLLGVLAVLGLGLELVEGPAGIRGRTTAR